MDVRIVRVLKLLGNKGVGQAGGDVFSLADGARHALLGRGQDQFGAQQAQQTAAFHAHRVRHGQDQTITARGAHKGQGDPRVAARRLNDHRIRADRAVPLGRRDHVIADAVLDAAERI